MKQDSVLDANQPIERYFEEISRIPRDSGNEKEISDYVVNFARERNLEVYQDEIWNVIVKKAASAGCEHKAPVILEAHMDMVCAKTAGSRHDFSRDGISLRLEDGILRAADTTLGADDGFGVAFMLAILDDQTLSHPPLECVFTVQEETGTIGAIALDKSRLCGKRLIGLDGDRERSTSVSCACSKRILLDKHYATQSGEGAAVRLKLNGFFTGTYQGVCHPECGNVIKIAARLLRQLSDSGISYQLAGWRGGTAENFNPFEGETILFVEEEERERVERLLHAGFEEILAEFGDERFRGSMTLDYGAEAAGALSRADSEELAAVVHVLPNNLFHTSADAAEMQAINNIGAITLENGCVHIAMSCRSKSAGRDRELAAVCRDAAGLAGFAVRTEERFRSWPYDENSALRKLANDILKRDCGYTLEETVCPGGLEIAYFFEGKEEFDALELGVDLENLHTPEEQMDMASFHRVYELVCKMLEKMD